MRLFFIAFLLVGCSTPPPQHVHVYYDNVQTVQQIVSGSWSIDGSYSKTCSACQLGFNYQENSEVTFSYMACYCGDGDDGLKFTTINPSACPSGVDFINDDGVLVCDDDPKHAGAFSYLAYPMLTIPDECAAYVTYRYQPGSANPPTYQPSLMTVTCGPDAISVNATPADCTLNDNYFYGFSYDSDSQTISCN